MKYLRLDDNTFVIWQENTEVHHSRMAQLYAKYEEVVKSAGFVTFNFQQEKFLCHGKSESLGKSSLPEDTDLINQWIQFK